MQITRPHLHSSRADTRAPRDQTAVTSILQIHVGRILDQDLLLLNLRQPVTRVRDAVLAQIARLRERLLAQIALVRFLAQVTTAYMHLQRVLAHCRVRAVAALERPYLSVSRLDMVVQLAQCDEAPTTQLAQEGQVVDMHVVHVLLKRRLLVERAPAQVAGGLVAQFGAVLGVEDAILERQSAVIARLAELRLEQAAVHALAVVVAATHAGKAALAPVALVGADGRLADAERLLLVVHVALVQR